MSIHDNHVVRSEDAVTYIASQGFDLATDEDQALAQRSREDQIIHQAQEIIRNRFNRDKILTSPDATRRYLQVMLANKEHEVFSCVFLDNRHRVIAYEEMFRGTVDGASVYPREVVKTALAYNAAATVFCHNHPSGVAEPSSADRQITKRLVDALAMVDIRVLDHVIVAETTTSFAERGML